MLAASLRSLTRGSALLSAAVIAVGCVGTPTPAKRPNVLFIAVDDLRPELGCYGVGHAQTPNLDALAASGIVFRAAHCQSAVCNPSRASLLTGRYPETIGVLDLQTDFRTAHPDLVTLPQQFGRHGYRTWAIGKIFHNVLPDPASWTEPKTFLDGFPFDPDAVYADAPNVAALEARKAEITAAGREARFIDRLGQWYLKHVATEAPDVPDSTYYDGAQTDFAIGKLAELQAAGQPFFAAVGYYRPHLPFNAPKHYWDLYDRDAIPLPEHPEPVVDAPPMAINTIRELRGYQDFKTAPTPHEGPLDEADVRRLRHGYLASVSYVDAQIGRLLHALDELGLRDDTIVVLWSDHGWKLGDHQSFCKMTNYEIDTRVPLIVRWPGQGQHGVASDALVELVDVYPTLCAMCDVPTPDGLAGQSLVPNLRDATADARDAAYSVFLRGGVWVAPDGVEYLGRTIRTARHRYVEWRVAATGELAGRELYDHVIDPGETRNVVDDPRHAATVAALAAELTSRQHAAEPR